MPLREKEFALVVNPFTPHAQFYSEEDLREDYENTKKSVDDPEGTWSGMAERLKKEDYQEINSSWKEIRSHITLDKSTCKDQCLGCGTLWDEEGHTTRYKPRTVYYEIGRRYRCHDCDRTLQPIASNPKNKDLVIKYIPKEFHDIIFE